MELCSLPTAAKRRSASALVLVFVVALSLIGDFRSDAQVLPKEEVQVLQELARKMGIGPWNTTTLSVDSCRGGVITSEGLTVSADLSVNSTQDVNKLSYVACDCSFNSSTVCHVTNIRLKTLELHGELPEEFTNLTYLRELDLALNYLNGTISRRFASLPLVTFSLFGNLIEGTIPREFGSIATLEELVLQDNKIGGPLPQELGNLPNLRRILLSGNNFTGVLPETFGNLRNLTEFRIDGSTLSGRIPEFIGNWTQLTRLYMQGTSMEGPIPSAISLLTNLEQLRITDLNVSSMTFPDLYNLTRLTDLILRNCSISGSIPTYIGQRMPHVKYLDLSFNRLNGTIPESLDPLARLQFMYLTNNSLTGEVSPWLKGTKFKFDISYNNFTGSAPSNCIADTLDYISSYPVEDNRTEWCWKKDLPCRSRPRSKCNH